MDYNHVDVIIIQNVLMEISDWPVLMTLLLVVLKCAIVDCGVLFAVLDGIILMLKLFADNLDSQTWVKFQLISFFFFFIHKSQPHTK